MNLVYIRLLKAAKNLVESPRSAVRREQLRNLVESKQCAKCQKYLPFEDFGDSERYFDGKRPYCKHCRKKYNL